ncbi:MAG: SDR family NAD(P)-dependent oxidoreductase [Pseudomonadota bacterium]|nr:SDR family NAD(P)-dependent oxidoreductase [Pseudomonadota bacterium]
MSNSPVSEKRIALVTGASRGIGAAVARRLARENVHVILLARTVGALEEVDDSIRTAGGTATIMPLDLLKGDDVGQIGPTVHQRFGRLDILVGNAAMLGPLSPVAHYDPKTWDHVMALNVGANQRLIRTLDPLLRASAAGRALFVTSGLARKALAYWGAYAASKAALEMLVSLYAAETVNTRLRVNMIDPGNVATGLRAQAFPGEDPAMLASPDEVAESFVEPLSEAFKGHGERISVRRKGAG